MSKDRIKIYQAGLLHNRMTKSRKVRLIPQRLPLSQHLQKSIEKLKRRILEISALAEESVYLAVRAIEERDAVLARKVIEADVRLDEEEVDVEEECLKILALHQPVALDLRFIVSG